MYEFAALFNYLPDRRLPIQEQQRILSRACDRLPRPSGCFSGLAQVAGSEVTKEGEDGLPPQLDFELADTIIVAVRGERPAEGDSPVPPYVGTPWAMALAGGPLPAAIDPNQVLQESLGHWKMSKGRQRDGELLARVFGLMGAEHTVALAHAHSFWLHVGNRHIHAYLLSQNGRFSVLFCSRQIDRNLLDGYTYQHYELREGPLRLNLYSDPAPSLRAASTRPVMRYPVKAVAFVGGDASLVAAAKLANSPYLTHLRLVCLDNPEDAAALQAHLQAKYPELVVEVQRAECYSTLECLGLAARICRGDDFDTVIFGHSLDSPQGRDNTPEFWEAARSVLEKTAPARPQILLPIAHLGRESIEGLRRVLGLPLSFSRLQS